MWKPGQSGNPKGRPKGFSMKEWVRERLEKMTDEERDNFLSGQPKEIVWKMAEGNPKEETKHTGSLTISQVLDGLEIDEQTVEDKPSVQDQKQEGKADSVQAKSHSTRLPERSGE